MILKPENALAAYIYNLVSLYEKTLDSETKVSAEQPNIPTPQPVRATAGQVSSSLFVRTSSGLIRQLTVKDAIAANMSVMVLEAAWIFSVLAGGLFPGANLVYSMLILVAPMLVIALIYTLMTSAMPRTGGDYVWVGRSTFPVVGFMVNFYITLMILTFVGSSVGLFINARVAPLLVGLQFATGTSFNSILTTIRAPNTSIEIGMVLVFIVPLVMLLGTKWAMRAIWVGFICQMIAVVGTIVCLLAVPQSTFIANFNKLSGMTYSGVISAAQAGGANLSFNWSDTLYAMYFLSTLFAGGFMASSYFAGEMKHSTKLRSQGIPIVGSLFLFAIISSILYGAFYLTAGQQFYHALAYSFMSGLPVYAIPAMPVGNVLLAFAVPNPYILGIIGIAYIIGALGTWVAFIFVVVRNLFSWSFDRLIPTKFSTVSSRFGTPYLAIILAIVLGEICVAVYHYTTFSVYMSYQPLGFAIAMFIACIAAVVFPYHRKDLFQASPSFVQKKIGGLPVITLLGILGMISSAYLAYASMVPAVAGAINPDYIYAMVAIFFVPLIIYYGTRAYEKSRGVPIDVAHKELPPE